MNTLGIFFTCGSSIAYFFISFAFKDLMVEKVWAFSVVIPVLIALTAIINLAKDWIAERDSSSKLYKLKKEISDSKVAHSQELEKYKNELAGLQGKIKLKDSIIHAIKSGLTNSVITHVGNDKIAEYVKALATKMNVDLEVNTIAPEPNSDTMRYMNLFACK